MQVHVAVEKNFWENQTGSIAEASNAQIWFQRRGNSRYVRIICFHTDFTYL